MQTPQVQSGYSKDMTSVAQRRNENSLTEQLMLSVAGEDGAHMRQFVSLTFNLVFKLSGFTIAM